MMILIITLITKTVSKRIWKVGQQKEFKEIYKFFFFFSKGSSHLINHLGIYTFQLKRR